MNAPTPQTEGGGTTGEGENIPPWRACEYAVELNRLVDMEMEGSVG